MTTSHDVSRREFLAVAGALPFAATVLRGQTRTIPVGLELYSVRDALAKDLPGTVTAVAKLGYQIVEFYAPYFDWTPDAAKDVRKLLDGLGITCRSTHNNVASFTGDGLKKAIELNQIIGSTTIVLASAPGPNTADKWKALGDQMTGVMETLRPLGMRAGFHNHQTEWSGAIGQRPMDILAANTPKDFVLQFDVGTCVQAGQDPVAWITANPGRIKSLHCKDWGSGQGRGYAVAFGEGDVPWKAIFAAAESTGGVEYYLIEQEIAGPAGELAMVGKCLDNWKTLRA
ncbi:MAG TPA: sugar phosphate isomerase/epimerase family protein [Vicinamibacterales bacterium]|jgi:sugar phosphate isomerase/epimerase|nr:sugar phosphate isomerase/epimerase family protein [Vicinamibacterales bacterium]